MRRERKHQRELRRRADPSQLDCASDLFELLMNPYEKQNQKVTKQSVFRIETTKTTSRIYAKTN